MISTAALMGLHHLDTAVSKGGKSGHFDHGKIWEISDHLWEISGTFRILSLEGWRIFGSP